MKINIKKEEEKYKNNLIKSLEKFAQTGFEMGFEVVEVRIKDNWVQEIGPFGYGDKYKIKAPDFKKLETDFGTIKISR